MAGVDDLPPPEALRAGASVDDLPPPEALRAGASVDDLPPPEALRGGPPPPDPRATDPLSQFVAGEHSALTYSAFDSAMRAAGHPVESASAPYPPHGGAFFGNLLAGLVPGGGMVMAGTPWPDESGAWAARLAGMGVGGVTDAVAARALPGAGAVEAMAKAKPLRTTAAVGGGYTGAQTAASEYGQEGKVNPLSVALNTLFGAGAGMAPNMPWTRGMKWLTDDPFKKLMGAVRGKLGATDEAAAKLTSASNAAGAMDVAAANADQQIADIASGKATAALGAPPKGKSEAGLAAQVRIEQTVDSLMATRQARADAMFDAARAVGDQHVPDLQRIHNAMVAPPQDVVVGHKQRDAIESVFSEIQRDFTPPQQPGPFGFVPPGSPAPAAAASNVPSNYLALREFRRTLKKREAASHGDAPMAHALHIAGKALDEELNMMTGGLHQQAVDAYRADSVPINRLLHSIGGKVIEDFDDYVQRGAAASVLGTYEKNAAKVWDTARNDQRRGAQTLIEGMGSDAEPFVRGQVASDLHGASSADMQTYLGKHADFLNGFPKVRVALEDAEKMKRASEGAAIDSQRILDRAISDNQPIAPAQARIAIAGYMGSDNLDKMRVIVGAARRQGQNSLARDAVADYYANQLQPIMERGSMIGPNSHFNQVLGVAENWQGKRDALVEAGAMSEAQADDISALMSDLVNTADKIKRGEQNFGAQDLQAGATHGLGMFAAGAYHTLQALRHGIRSFGDKRELYMANVAKIMQDSIKDPAIAAELRAAFDRGGRDTILSHVLLYPDIKDATAGAAQ